MSLERLYTRPGHLIRRMQQIAVAIFHEELAGENITPVQYATLAAIDEYPDLDIKRLANLIAVDRSTLGSVVDRFDAQGLVIRTVDDADRRSRLVRIAAPGKALLTRIEPAVARAQDRIVDHLTAAERRTLMGFLAVLVHVNNNLSRAPLRRDGGTGNLSLYNKPGHLIRRLQQICDGVFVEYVSQFNITPVQYAGLVAVSEYRDLDNTRLANLIALDRATLGSVVGRLEAKGWITGTVNETDRRAKRLNITPDGERLLAELRPAIDRAEERIVDTLSAADRRRFFDLISKVVDVKNDVSRAPQREVPRPGAS